MEIQFEPHQVYRPDVAGWRRERLPKLPDEVPLTARPDWICEILSTNQKNDLVKKMRAYRRSEVPHSWLLDPVAETLTVYRWTPGGYLLVLDAEGRERVRAEPFEGVEIAVHDLVAGDEEEEG